MKAILEVPEQNYKGEFDNISLSLFRRVGERPSDISPMITEKFPIGDPIVLFTSNMPPDLQKKVDDAISEYCGI